MDRLVVQNAAKELLTGIKFRVNEQFGKDIYDFRRSILQFYKEAKTLRKKNISIGTNC